MNSMTHAGPNLLPHRTVISVTGPDAREFLQRVITNGPDGVAPGAPVFAALLTPQGKVLSDFFLFDDGDGGLLIDAPESEAEALAKRFSLYRMRATAEITLRPELATAASASETTAQALAGGRDPRSSGIGWRGILPAGQAQDADEAYDARRIAQIAPEFGADYGPAEVFSTDVNHDLLAGIDYRKGCFVGQEVASRMHRKGGVRKRTIRLEFDGPAPAAGAEVFAGETALGAISSAAGAAALARIRTDRLGEAETVLAGGMSARVVSPAGPPL